MKPRYIAVCNQCDENNEIIKGEEYTDICKHCGGKISDRNGKVFTLEIWERRQRA